jgi:hypothetical protein
MDILLPGNFHIATVNYAAITSQTKENHLLGNKETQIVPNIHSLTILISATDQWRYGPDSQYVNFWIQFYKFYVLISTRLSDSVRV